MMDLFRWASGTDGVTHLFGWVVIIALLTVAALRKLS